MARKKSGKLTTPKTEILRPRSPNKLAAPAGYGDLLDEIKTRIRASQIKASLAVNRELIALYWSIGHDIVQRQDREGWGQSIVEQLGHDIRVSFPGIAGFSARNIWRMRAFYIAWSAAGGDPVGKSGKPILPQPAAELERTKPRPSGRKANVQNSAQLTTEVDGPILPQPVAEIPWGHNVVLLEKLEHHSQRLWYAQETTAHGWSRSMLLHWIESDLYSRQGKAITNFRTALPAPQSDLAEQLIRDPYNFDFLMLHQDAAERDLEMGLLDHIRRFLIELGAGFAFVGQQVPIDVGGDDYSIDLLFYHLKLRCFVVIDLKPSPSGPRTPAR